MKVNVNTCPSCGGPGKIKEKNRTIIKGETLRNCYVYCPNCDFRGPRVLYQDYSEPHLAELAAVDKWNRRV